MKQFIRTAIRERRVRWEDFKDLVLRHAALLGSLVAAGLLGFVVWSIVHGQSQNRQAIEKGCILLNNKIVEAQSGSQARASTILIQEILRNAVKQGRGYVVVRYRNATREHPAKLSVIDCREVARHPERIRALPSHP